MNWRCFHCGDVFLKRETAQLHFGDTIWSDPACQVDVKRLRELENELLSYRCEDTDLHRQIYKMESDHARALIREEEKGYARGLKDGMELSRTS